MGTSMDPPTITTTASDTAASVEEPPASSMPSASEVETPATTRSLMGPPPPENPTSPNTEPPQSLSAKESEHDSASTSAEEQPPLRPPPPPQDSSCSKQRQSQNVEVPYTIPQWSEAPSYPFQLELLKDGSIIDQLDVTKKGAYMFGRVDICDFVLEHPTISRFHAVLQFKGNGDAYLYDLGSTHGTFINKNQVKQKVYVKLHVGDVIRFGLSSRLYIFQGPTELMPSEADLTNVNYAKDREASLRRAREDAALADGISWGMREDAIEEAENDSDEITWPVYKGEFTEKQQKTREKVLKTMEKIAHMKKEMSAIRAKDIAQGGLTQGQQTQIARNELRISEIMEELESLEETLNDSICESIGARAGRSSLGRQKGPVDEEDEFLSDDDEFYDRTKKKSANKAADTQSIETADSLLDKQEALIKEMEGKRGLLLEEKNKMSESGKRDAGDALDAFMPGLSSQLVSGSELLRSDFGNLQDLKSIRGTRMTDFETEKDTQSQPDELGDTLNDLFTSVSTMIKSELQGTDNLLELLEKMNLRVAEEYNSYGDVASGLRIFVEQLKYKGGSFEEYIHQINAIDQQVTEFEVVISMLDKYVFMLERKVQSAYQNPPS